MPIYKVNGETYDIPASKQEAFEKRYPDASVSYINAGDTYEIPLNRRDAFLKKYPDAYLTSLEVPSTEQPKTAYSPAQSYGDGADTNAQVPMFNDKPNPPLDTVRGFGKAAAQSARGLGAGVQNLWGEFTNIFTGSSRDDANALAEFDRMMSEGIDVNDATEGAWTDMGRELRTGALELLPGWMIKGWKQNVHDKAEKMKVLDTIRDVLSETGGDVGKARALLQQRAKDQSYGDRQMQAAAETMGEMKPTEGFGAWLGENMVQMIPSASALLVGAVTRSPAAAKVIGGLGIGAMTAATSGQSMYEARQAGASDYETRKTGVVDGMIEVITEKIPFDRYTKRIVGKAKKEVAEQMARALSDKNSPAREELQNLLTRANRLLGGQLFSKKTAQEYIADIIAEGASEFSAEALQTMSSIIYEEPENYPEFSEIMSNGFQGLLAGAFMGSVLGGSSLALGSQQNKQRRKEQGFVKIGLIDNGDNGMDIGEIAAYDPERQMFTITDGINSYEVGRNKIKQTFDYTYEEFESARYRQLEDEAIDNGTVTDGQMSASGQRLNKERGRFDMLMSNEGLSDEEKAKVFASIERGDVPALPKESDWSLWKAARSYADAYERYADMQRARYAKALSERNALHEAMEQKLGKFWHDGSETAMDNGFSIVEPKTVEFGTLADGRNVYIISGVNEDGEVAAVTEDGERLFVNHTMMPNGTRIMSLDEYLNERLAQQKTMAEQERMATENTERVNDVRQQVSLGMEVNLGTQEAPIMGTVLEVMPANDGVLVQTEQGVAQLSWEKVADVLNVGTASMTDLEIAAKDAADILESESAWEEVTARTEQEVALASSAEEVAAVASEDAEPLPLKQDGSVDQTTLWNKSPERWARWNDEQRQDGGVNSINYINNALAKAQKDLDSAVKAYDKETDFEAREAMEEGISAKQERVARLSALQQSYLPENAQEQAAAQVTQETAGVQSPATQAESSQTAQALPAPEQTIYDLFSDESLSEDEIEAYIDANVAGSQSDLDKHLNKAPKMGRDMEKYKADKAKHEEKTRELTAIRDHWRQVRAYLNPPTVEMDMEPQNALEAASKELTRKDGISLLPESFRHHTGYGRGEQVAFLSILRKKENGGMTLEAAGERLMADYPEFFDQNDPNAGLNAILEVLQSAASSSDLYNYINNAREDVARQEADAVRSAVIQQVEETKNRLTDANGTETTQISDLSVSEENSSIDKDSSNPAISNESEENVDGFTSTLDEDMPDFESMSDEEVKRMAIEAVVPETERQRFQDEKRNTLKDRIREWEQRLGAKVKVMDSIDDVTNSQAKAQIEKGGEVWGWFETSTGEVCIYLPDFMSLSTSAALSEIDKTYIHEIVSHKGLRGLLGEDAYGELCDMVWEAMTEEEQQSWMQYPGVNGNTRAAADEYIAHFAESVEYNQTIWDKIVKFIKDLFASKDVAINISDEGLTELLRASYDKLVSEASARMEPEKISLNDYLGRLGLSSPISDYMDDKLRNPHGLSESQRNQLEKEAKDAADDYHARRNAAIDEYNRMVAEGKIIPPTQIDRLIATANGHPDNEATQAARRSLEKRGYDWQTGQKKPAEVQSEPKKASKTIKAEKAKDEKIEDFGEKIGGARKDVARAKIRDSVKLTTKDLVELKDPDKILSRKNIIKYYSEGVMTFEDAVKLLAMNMAVRGRDTINRGVAMKKYRNLAMAWESGAELIVEITDEDVQDRMNEYSERMRQAPDIEKKTREGLELFVLKLYNDYKATYEALNYPEVYRNLKSAYIRYGDHDGKYWVVYGPNAYRGYPFPTLEQAIAKMVKLYPEQTIAKKPSESKKDGEKSSSIHVTKDRAGYYRIKSRNIPGEIYLSGKLYSKKDAEAYLAENLDKLVERENRLLEALLGSNIGMVEREGLDYRKGKDVTPKDFLDTFGFRGVEFGNWVPQVERQAYLNKTYDAIMDFCRIVGISPKAFSLGGRLGLAFGSRGKSRALAHYEPMKEVINLTRMKGAGSLAHEWFHALDNYLAKQRSGNTSDMTTDNKPAVRQEVTDAFNAFVSAMNRLAYTRRSNRAGQYWGEVWERAARLFESYIYNELGGQNIVSPLLVKKDTLYVDHGEFSDDAWPYPSAEENEQMKPYFDRLFSTLQEQVEEDGSVTLFRAKDAGRKQAQFDIINETNPMTDDYHVGIRKVEDIKTFDEVMETARRESEEGGWPELASYPDIENSLLEEALETRRIVIYSSHPISNGTFVTPSYIQADEYSGMTGEVYSKEVSVDDIAWINTDEGQYASLNDATDRYNDTPEEDIRFRTEQTKDRVENLFTAAVNGTFKGKPVSIGTLTKEGKQYLESISGLKFKDKVDFMLNASDLVHMYNEHFGVNEKDPGSNIPLTIDDIRNIVDVVLSPEKVLYLGEEEGKRFAFLAPADSGAYNLIEVYTTKRGNLSSKTFYKTKKGVSHRAMILEKESRHSTSETNGATLSDAKIPILFDIANQGNDNTLFRTRITPEQDAAYMKAVEAGDMETAQRMVNEAARLAGYDSNSDYQGSLAFNGAAPSGYAYYDTKEERIEAWESGEYEDDQTLGDYKDAGIDISNLGWSLTSPVAQRMGNEYTRESIKNLADAVNSDSRKIKVYRAVDADIKEDSVRNGDWLTPSRAYAEYHIGLQDWKEGRIIEQEVDIDDIWWDGNDINEWGYNDGKGYAYKNTPNNRKLLAPVTYDDGGNVIPLSERFKEEKDDIRFRTTEIIPEVREEMAKIKESAERNGTYLKAPNGQPTNLTPEQWMMVRTEGFKFWFGDWEKDPENASKVIDINGEPMVVYHGTQSKFTAFDVGYKGKNFGFRLSDGFYFSPDETVAESYASFPDELKTGEVKAVFLNIINPFHIKSAKDYRDQITEIVSLAARGNRYQADLIARMSESELLSQRGYDGVVEERIDGITGEIVVFEPYQIKSATDNVGVFSPYNDIRFRTRYDVNTNPTEAQKKAGNYKMGHIRLDGYNITIENPKGSVRRGTDSKGNAWENTLNNDYGYIRGTEGVDGDHIDVYLSDNPAEGNVFVIDQVNPETREFDEHKVMYGFNSAEEAREAYLANFSEGWNGLGTITEVSKDEFKKWIESSHRKTKPFSEYKSVRANEMQTTDDSGLRYRVVTDPKTLNRLNSEPTIKVYRAMQLIDGKLYPPMSAKVDGELRQPIELGQWEEAEERPDLVDEKGRFKLDKGNKTSLKARYNPYFHTSPTPLNDQFSSAQTRPELVTVEVEVPESELTSGYKAEKAKDAVGKLEWKAGVVQSKLSGTRTVILSRWDKPVRIVPDSEVADVIVDMFEGKDITMPSNVVTPSLREELEKRGVPFIETDNQGNPIEETRFRSVGAPTEDVVARGLELSRQDAARLAGDIYSIMPADIRKRVSAEVLNNGMDLQKTIFQISASLAEKDSLSDEETAFAKSVADILEQRLLDDGVEMTRPLTTPEALWMLWRNSNPVGEDDVFGAARRAVVADNLGMSTRFRAADKRNDSDNRSKQFREATASAAADAYNRSVSFWKNRLKESYVDNMDSVNILVEAIEKASGKAAQGWEDIRLTMNQLSSKGLSAMEKFIRDYLHPMWDAVEAIMKKMDIDKADVERYIMLESGLERNEVFAKRDAKAKHQDEYDKQMRSIEGMEVTDEEKAALKVKAKNTLDRRLAAVDAGTDATYKKMRERDYGAVMAQFAEYAPIKDQSAYGSLEEYNRAKLNSRRLKYSTVEEAESAAWEEINAFRQKAGEELIDNLWKRINAATKATLKQQYEANMLSKAQYDHIRGMFKYYVPMRGFADNTAEDMYSYYANGQNDFAAPVLKAKGRTTMAESPLGHIGAMASSGIAQGLKNEAKLALYYFVLNRPNDLVSVDKTWYVDTGRADEEGKAIFEAKYPPMTGALSEEKARADYEKWQNEMKELEKQGKAVRGSRKLDLKNSVIHITPSSAKEHTITVKVGGEEITMFINGNPRAAQAVNGLLNIEASDKFEGMRKYLRFLSSVNTSFNPEFWMTNLQRDILFTAMAISSKEDAQYNKAFRENYWKAWKAVTMVRKNKKGTLGDSHVEQLFNEFVENGGPTGYTKVIGNEEWEKTMNKYLSRKDRPKAESIRKAFDALQSFSEGIEQVSRFAAYMTSREMGRSVQQSISDAKEVTVNFNRKGSGQEITKEEVDKLTDENGQPLSELSKFCIRMISKISPYGRGFLMFFNASVQGLNSFVRLTKNNPKAMSIWASGYLMLGILNASLHAMLDDDDEYLDIPDYERRTSLLLGGNGAYFKWALPQEARAFYALGDLFVNRTLDRMPHQNVIWEATKILFDVAPLNPTEGIAGVLPPYVATVVELATNKDYKGAKIYKDMAYLSDEAKKGVPEYTKTFSGTSEVAVALSRAINWLSGGDYATSGYLDGFLTNPAVMQHVVESQLGGTLRTINKALDTIWNIGGLAVGAEDAEFTVRNTPFLNRLLTINDERYRNSHTTDLYKHYKGVAANAKRREKEYSAAHDSENLNSLRSSEDYAVFQIYQRHKKVLDMYDKQLKLARNEQERRLIMQRQDAERKRMIEEISRL